MSRHAVLVETTYRPPQHELENDVRYPPVTRFSQAKQEFASDNIHYGISAIHGVILPVSPKKRCPSPTIHVMTTTDVCDMRTTPCHRAPDSDLCLPQPSTESG